MPPADIGIREFTLTIVPVSDQDRSIAFYESLGLEKRTDVAFAGGQMRWVEVYAPIGSTGIALAPPPPGRELTPTQTGITLRSEDIESTHAALLANGVDVDAQVMPGGDGVPKMLWLRDPDGHTLMIVQPTD